MTRKRLDAFYLLLLGCAVFLLLGIVMALASPSSMLDFKVIYYGSRSASHHSDPYAHGQILSRYFAEGGTLPAGAVQSRIARDVLSMCIYPPTALLFMVPLSFLNYGPAHIIWLGLLLLSFILASILAWDLAAEFDPMLAAVLGALLMANNVIAVGVGNSAVLVVAFCVIPVWCFVRRRFVWAGALLLAVALGTKPHDAIWVWLVLLLAGGPLRRRASKSVLVLAALAASAVFWIGNIAPHWWHELGANVSALGAPGGLSDPSLAAKGERAVSMVISLQAVFSAFIDNPHLYNLLSYLVCAPLIILWAWATLRSGRSAHKLWLSFAALIPIAMLPIYHRPYDAKLLLLAIPAAVIFFHRGGRVGKLAFWLNFAAIVLTADLPWMGLQLLLNRIHPASSGVAAQIWTAFWVYPVPLALLAAGIVNLWIYHEHCSGRMLPDCASVARPEAPGEGFGQAKFEAPVTRQYR